MADVKVDAKVKGAGRIISAETQILTGPYVLRAISLELAVTSAEAGWNADGPARVKDAEINTATDAILYRAAKFEAYLQGK